MGILAYSDIEWEYLVRTVSEFFTLMGYDALLYQVECVERSLHYDIDSATFWEPVKIGIAFETNPKPLLRKWFWNTEESAKDTQVVHMGFMDTLEHYIACAPGMEFTVQVKHGIPDVKRFRVNEVHGDALNPLMWVCTVSPVRAQSDFRPEDPGEVQVTRNDPSQTRYSYLNMQERSG